MSAGNGSRGAYDRKYINPNICGFPADIFPEGLHQVKLAFEEQCAVYRIIAPTFAQLASIIIHDMKWNVEIFKEKTHMDKATFSRIMNDTDKKWSLRTVVAFCFGAGIGIEPARVLLSAAGYLLDSSHEQCAYRFLLTSFCGEEIAKCNAFLEYIGVEPLGNRSRQEAV